MVVHNPKAYYQKTGTKQIGIIKTQNITINGVEYKGYFLKQATEGVHKIVMTFTALGNNVCVWGSKK